MKFHLVCVSEHLHKRTKNESMISRTQISNTSLYSWVHFPIPHLKHSKSTHHLKIPAESERFENFYCLSTGSIQLEEKMKIELRPRKFLFAKDICNDSSGNIYFTSSATLHKTIQTKPPKYETGDRLRTKTAHELKIKMITTLEILARMELHSLIGKWGIGTLHENTIFKKKMEIFKAKIRREWEKMKPWVVMRHLRGTDPAAFAHIIFHLRNFKTHTMAQLWSLGIWFPIHEQAVAKSLSVRHVSL